jgi:hypothetical protein
MLWTSTIYYEHKLKINHNIFTLVFDHKFELYIDCNLKHKYCELVLFLLKC